MDLSIFLTAETWISLVTLIFLEIVLGVDNLVFITLTCNKLPRDKQHIGRKLGLLGAFVSRCIFLSVASWLANMTEPLFTLPVNGGFGVSVRTLILLFGGIYLVYKGVTELRDVLALTEEKAELAQGDRPTADGGERHDAQDKRMRKPHDISMAQAIGTIMVMDVVFSIDSVITAVGLASYLIIMIMAVMIAIILMMVFIDPISDFINAHVEMKILALVFIAVIGVLLALDGCGITTGIEVLGMHMEKVMVYFAMLFSFVLTLIQMRRSSNYEKWRAERSGDGDK